MAFTHKVCGTTVTAICLMLPDGSANVWGALSCPKCESQVTIGECNGAYDDTVEMNAQPFIPYGDANKFFRSNGPGVSPTWETGPVGPQGSQGIQGVQGVQGPQGVQGIPGVSPWVPPFGLNLSGLAIRSIKANLTATGYNDLYTVPANKKAILYTTVSLNYSGVSSNVAIAIKIGGAYYNISGLGSNVDAATTFRVPAAAFVAAAGESFAFSTSQQPINVSSLILEFDATVNIHTAYLTTLNTGNNTLYTVPTGKTAILVPNGYTATGTLGSSVGYFNNSGNNRAFYVCAIPSGGTPGVTNKFSILPIVASGAGASNPGAVLGIMGLASDDLLVVNTDDGTATQFAWVTVMEV